MSLNTTPVTHVLKSWETFYRDIITGMRTSDLRLNDRRYAVGDFMLLREFDSVAQEYTGRECLVEITYLQNTKSNPCAISHRALHEDYVVLSIRLVRKVFYIDLEAYNPNQALELDISHPWVRQAMGLPPLSQ